MPVIEGAIGAPYQSAGAPGAGTNEVQTITIGGTPTGGTFILVFDGLATTAISWTATDATLVADIDAALEALPNIGTAGVTTAAGTVSSGIGTITVTFAGGNVQKKAVTTLVVRSSLTGTAPTIAVTETTPGVDVFGKGVPKGGLVTDTTNGKLYINTGTAAAPTWTVVGAQS